MRCGKTVRVFGNGCGAEEEEIRSPRPHKRLPHSPAPLSWLTRPAMTATATRKPHRLRRISDPARMWWGSSITFLAVIVHFDVLKPENAVFPVPAWICSKSWWTISFDLIRNYCPAKLTVLKRWGKNSRNLNSPSLSLDILWVLSNTCLCKS